jgi:hypothetical protein
MKVGVYSLGDTVITAAGTYLGDPITGLDGMTAVSTQFRFVYGSGGTTARAYLQTSFDQGTTWADIACSLFATANEINLFNHSGLTAVSTPATPADGTLTDDTAVQGLLGDRLRLKIISTGIYAGQTLLSGRVAVR